MLDMQIQNGYIVGVKRLLEAREQLMAAFASGAPIDFQTEYTRLLDEYFCQSFEQSMVGPTMGIARNPYAVIAIGGYGRQEQCLHSDVDILFLFKKRIPDEAEGLIREMIFPLWDIGIDIGHATRSLSECLNLAAKDYEVLTSLLDARFICGMSPIYSEMMERLREKVLFRKADRIISWLVESTRERHRLFGDSAYLLEPNIKEGQGGLRDYHALLWIAQVKFGLSRPRDLEYRGFLSHEEYEALAGALSFIWGARNFLHRFICRKYDRLHFEYQPRLARAMGYQIENGQKPVERFLGDLHCHMERVKQRHMMFLHELGAAKKWFKIPRRSSKGTRTEGIEIKRDQLCFSAPENIIRTPMLMIKIFEESARLKLPLSPEASRLIREFSYLIDANFIRFKPAVKTFEQILLLPAPTFNVLNEMLNTRFLERFIPEFEEIIDRIEYDAYHVYPVDKHSLRTVQILKRFAAGEDDEIDPLSLQLFREVSKKRLLLWAGLLHDIGKGIPDSDHSQSGAEITERILGRIGMRPKEIAATVFLVQEHLFLIRNATRRDINDEETVMACARRIKDPHLLKMLYLLTVADLMATGPKAWNEWTAILLRDLFFNILNILENGDLGGAKAIEILRQKEAQILERAAPQQRQNLEPLLAVMSPRYLVNTTVSDILSHIDLYRELGDGNFLWKIEKVQGADARRIALCGKDSPGFFAKLAGILTVNGIGILDAQFHTWKNGITLDILTVTPPPDPLFEEDRWERVQRELRAAMEGKIDVDEVMQEYGAGRKPLPIPEQAAPNRVVVDNHSSSFFTIIEVYTHDRPGLLYGITDALFRCGLDIRSAQIATRVDQAVDVFYVRDQEGQKVDEPIGVRRIQERVSAVLPTIAHSSAHSSKEESKE